MSYFQYGRVIIKYIPLQQGLRHDKLLYSLSPLLIIKYIPLQQGLRLPTKAV